jgi:ABC-type oligopeptide transport system ATPase subunit
MSEATIKTKADKNGLPLLEDVIDVHDLKMHFPITKGLLKRKVGAVKAVDGVSFAIKRGQTLGIVGESGSGKSTIGHCILNRYKITGGDIIFEGHNFKNVSSSAMRQLRKNLQMITQDPFASLDPRMDIASAIT